VRSLRILDTGLRSARWNIAATAALAELHGAGTIGDTVRFGRYRPSVLLGRHQIVAREIRIDRCRATGVEIARRMTGGGAVYMDPGILAWDVVLDRRSVGWTFAEANARICDGIARGLARLGLPAAFRSPNEVEIGGRRVSGSSGYFTGPTFVCQGTVLIEFDPVRMADVLRLPADRNAVSALSERLVAVADILGHTPEPLDIENALIAGMAEVLGREIQRENITVAESILAEHLLAREYGNDDFVFRNPPLTDAPIRIGRRAVTSGLIEAHVRLRPGVEQRIDQIWITGPFSAVPARVIPDLENTLRDLPMARAAQRALSFLNEENAILFGAAREDIAAVIAAADQAEQRRTRAP